MKTSLKIKATGKQIDKLFNLSHGGVTLKSFSLAKEDKHIKFSFDSNEEYSLNVILWHDEGIDPKKAINKFLEQTGKK